jgi:hypothetical protein
MTPAVGPPLKWATKVEKGKRPGFLKEKEKKKGKSTMWIVSQVCVAAISSAGTGGVRITPKRAIQRDSLSERWLEMMFCEFRYILWRTRMPRLENKMAKWVWLSSKFKSIRLDMLDTEILLSADNSCSRPREQSQLSIVVNLYYGFT